VFFSESKSYQLLNGCQILAVLFPQDKAILQAITSPDFACHQIFLSFGRP